MGFRIVAIEESVAKQVRSTMSAPGYGHPAWSRVAEGKAPCRLCLEYIVPGQERLVGFTYDAFHGWEDLPLPGPIFVHERECAPYATPGEFPPALRGSRYVLDAYQHGRVLRTEQVVDGERAGEALTELLARSGIAYVHVRSATAGCFEFAALPA